MMATEFYENAFYFTNILPPQTYKKLKKDNFSRHKLFPEIIFEDQTTASEFSFMDNCPDARLQEPNDEEEITDSTTEDDKLIQDILFNDRRKEISNYNTSYKYDFSRESDKRTYKCSLQEEVILEEEECESADEATSADDIESVEHPLETPWTFWCDRTGRGATAEEYKNSLKMVRTVATVEQFWQVHHNLPPVNCLANGVNNHIMRVGWQPMWEDKANTNGGTWRFRVPKQHSVDIWLELAMAALGEQLADTVTPTDMIVGVSISIRERDDIIQVWNTDSSTADASTEVLVNKVKELYPNAATYLSAFYKPNQAHAFNGNIKTE